MLHRYSFSPGRRLRDAGPSDTGAPPVMKFFPSLMLAVLLLPLDFLAAAEPEATPVKELPLPGKVFAVAGRTAFVLKRRPRLNRGPRLESGTTPPCRDCRERRKSGCLNSSSPRGSPLPGSMPVNVMAARTGERSIRRSTGK